MLCACAAHTDKFATAATANAAPVVASSFRMNKPRENHYPVSAPTLKADESENGLHPSARYSRIAAGFRGYDNEAMAVLEESVKEFAHSLGFSLCGIAPATAADGFDRLTDWLGRGFAGEMEYMRKQYAARRHPESILNDVRSVIMVAMEYCGTPRGAPPP